MSRRRCREAGLSLLELLVALAIMALAMGTLYRVLGANVRNVGMLQDQHKALLLAKSLLSAKDAVDESGWNESGETAGYVWQVRSQPYSQASMQAQPGAARLFAIQIDISWTDGGQLRNIELHTLRPQRLPVVPQGGGA